MQSPRRLRPETMAEALPLFGELDDGLVPRMFAGRPPKEGHATHPHTHRHACTHVHTSTQAHAQVHAHMHRHATCTHTYAHVRCCLQPKTSEGSWPGTVTSRLSSESPQLAPVTPQAIPLPGHASPHSQASLSSPPSSLGPQPTPDTPALTPNASVCQMSLVFFCVGGSGLGTQNTQ